MKNEKIFRLITPQDLPTRVEWVNTPIVQQNMGFGGLVTLEDTNSWYSRIVQDTSRMDFVLEQDGKLLAMAGVTTFKKDSLFAEVYIMVNPECRGKGLGQLASLLAFNRAFQNSNCVLLYSYISTHNTPSMNMFSRIGFTPIVKFVAPPPVLAKNIEQIPLKPGKELYCITRDNILFKQRIEEVYTPCLCDLTTEVVFSPKD